MNKLPKLNRAVLLACACAGIVTIGGTFAYLSDTEAKDSQFTVGSISTELYENAKKIDGNNTGITVTNLVPGEEVDKAPTVKNTGKNRALVFVEISVPRAEIMTADASGAKQPKALTELFTLIDSEGKDLSSTSAAPGWKRLGTDEVDAQTNAVKRVFAYDTVLQAGGITKPVFSKVRVANALEGEIDPAVKTLDIHTVSIQADNLTTADAGGNPTDAELSAAYAAALAGL